MRQSEFYVGDAINIMRGMPRDTYGGVVTAPPCNLGIDYGILNYSDRMTQAEYDVFTKEWIHEALRVAPVVVMPFFAPSSDPLRLGNFMVAASKVGVIQSHIIWAKNVSTEEFSQGHYTPINSKRYLNNVHESIFIISRDGSFPLDRKAVGVPYTDKSNMTRFKNVKDDIRCRGNLWLVPYQTRHKEKEFPATFPPALADLMIKVIGSPAHILDPFAGSGTTIQKALELDLICDGIDLKQPNSLDTYYDMQRAA